MALLPSYFRLAKIKENQKSKFETLKNWCSQYYIYLSGQSVSDFTTSLWENYKKKLEEIILPSPRFSFLRDRVIRETMFVMAGGKWIKEELGFLEKSFSREKLTKVLEEDYIGNPILINSTYLTSHTSIHHLYHFAQFQEKTKNNLESITSVIEWGGGYGNMAKILKRIAPMVTFTIIDLPVMSCLQWLYLATVFGEDKVNMLTNPKNEIEKGKINILPLSFLKNRELNAELFIATWSLSESSRYAQDYVVSQNFFGAKHLLLSYQKSGQGLPDAGRVGEIAKNRGAVIFPINFLPGSYYAFK